MTYEDEQQPSGQGLYRPQFEHDACGIGALAHMQGKRSHQMLDDALSVLVNLEHRGGIGLEKNTGDGAGILFQIPHRFFRKEAQKWGACFLPKVITVSQCCFCHATKKALPSR